MSRWRRIALEELPWCKAGIEEAKTPHAMWVALREELEDALRASPPRLEQARKIVAYAARCKGVDAGFLDPWAFFDTVLWWFIGGDESLRVLAAPLIPESAFEFWIAGIADTAEEAAGARSAFYAARRASKAAWRRA